MGLIGNVLAEMLVTVTLGLTNLKRFVSFDTLQGRVISNFFVGGWSESYRLA